MHKKIISSLLLFSFGFPNISFGATDSLTVRCTPEFPVVLTQIYCTVSGIPNIEKYHIEWRVNDSVHLSGMGFRNFSFRTGPLPLVYAIRATVQKSQTDRPSQEKKMSTRKFGSTIDSMRLRLVDDPKNSQIRLELSPRNPRSYEIITLTLQGRNEEASKILSKMESGSISWKKYNEPEVSGGPIFTFRIGSTREKIPIKVKAGTLGEISLTLAPAPEGFIAEYDNAARAALCTQRALDNLDRNIGRVESELDDFVLQLNNLVEELQFDIYYLTTFWENLSREITHDTEVIAGAFASSNPLACKIIDCVRIGLRYASATIKAAVFVYTQGFVAERVNRVKKSIHNIETFPERIEELVKNKAMILNNLAKQTERQVNRCNEMFKKVNTYGL